ncbi:hypothetical protein HH214_06565 [Mucilaginibacter robiniae]|uniref:YMGG-like Gly-zipper domain-containing protein n=1 Tax=Mucilaginibacter robiniae TaxID=2728022 RepID=A0A7L5DZU8_9SPHI|nr:YMGG-like glycine zipper-containing protein [Mucilaginibacter robiniae]QJD95559.1 hypothetical protein HH214_06565 [Mucilaginibacter robiniae]
MKKIILLITLISSVILASSNYTLAQHRRMSGQAKGALIGGAGGAIAGGLIGHGVKGALIGGAIGAGGGYIIGNEHRRNVHKRHAAYYRAHHTYYSRRRH